MVTLITTWEGPADKLIIDGDFFRYHWTDKAKETEWKQTHLGRITLPMFDMSLPGKVILSGIFDTKEHATASLMTGRPHNIYKDDIEGHNDEGRYIHENGITCKTEIVE